MQTTFGFVRFLFQDDDDENQKIKYININLQNTNEDGSSSSSYDLESSSHESLLYSSNKFISQKGFNPSRRQNQNSFEIYEFIF